MCWEYWAEERFDFVGESEDLLWADRSRSCELRLEEGTGEATRFSGDESGLRGSAPAAAATAEEEDAVSSLSLALFLSLSLALRGLRVGFLEKSLGRTMTEATVDWLRMDWTD